MSDKLSTEAAAARRTQAEYLEGLQREAQAYKDAGRKDRAAEVQAEIKRVEATLEPAGKSGSTTTRNAGKGGKGGKGAAETTPADEAGTAGDASGGVADGAAGDGETAGD